MIAHVHFNELYPCYRVSEDKKGDKEIEVTEEELAQWQDIRRQFFDMQRQIELKMAAYEHKKLYKQDLDYIFDQEHSSRRDKGYILKKFGWTQTDTSEWELEGRKARLHEAFEECRQIHKEAKLGAGQVSIASQVQG